MLKNSGVPKGPNLFLIVLYLLLGIYFINYPFQFIKIPEAILKADSWIIFAGGLLLVLGSVHYFQAKRRPF